MKKTLYFFFGMLLLSGIYQACAPDVELPGSIYGVVADKATGEPIKSAGVELSPGGLKTITGSEGQFEFVNQAPGSYTLLITKTGYSDYASPAITVQANQQTKVDVQIEKLPPALKVVNDNREEISTLDFGSSVDDVARSFSLFNDGTESLEWQITITAEWIKSVSKTEGVLSAGATQSLIVTLDRTKLKSGKNTTTAHITSNNGSKQLTITATNSTILATLNTLDVTNVKTTTATLNGEILTDGTPKYSERGFVYAESSMPTLSSCIQKITSTLTDSNTYSAIVAGLTKGKTYYVRAYAINAGEEAYSSNEVSFVPSSVSAKVTTNPVSNIARNEGRATFNGTIVDNGDPVYTERGFVYGITHNPMVESDTKIVAAGKGLGEFSVNADSLQVGEVYYVRAYATNEQGTAYGEEVECDFKAIHPAVTTGAVKDIARSAGTATFVGRMVEEGDPIYTEHGFVYSTLHNPTLENDTNVIAAGKGKGEFITNVTNLQVGATYYIRAYAKNEYVTVYGEEVECDFKAIHPAVTTGAVKDIARSAGTATFVGRMVEEGDPIYTEHGFVYSTLHNPTLENDTTVIAAGKGKGEFTSNVTNLQVGVTYYVRAYAKNEYVTVYGEEVTADFSAIAPQVTTVSVEFKSNTSAYFIGKITNVGDPEYTERGFIYGTMQIPMIDDDAVTKVVVAKNTSAQFEKQITNANWGNHLWYIRAYAISSAGVSYGEIKTIQDPEYAEYLKLPTFDFAGYLYHVYPDMGAMTWSQAKLACNGLSYGGYDDWYLPNKEELNDMYQKKSSIGGFSSTYYWSSTEYNSSYAWDQYFYNGAQDYDGKSYTFRVRCVRREN